ncbi:hypothetical protein NAPIS_ORF00811 [Vairimorpha apis BRL 01]|uniref:Uncharacterized protein n=1 Tax=Vairimorpha apis BRL 01 TaxID=1037528 RepID=T0L271_9MICR|nr:hypothetical protein NAPIS_ORF00811 [Vairimorpha apis BRL 01]
MINNEIKKTKTYLSILNQDIEKYLKEISIRKSYISLMNEAETIFDKNSSSHTLESNLFYEDYVRKKKTNNLLLNEDIRLDDQDIINDLNEMYDNNQIQVRVLDSVLYIFKNGLLVFKKHDKILVKGNIEYIGNITSVDTNDIIVKSKDGKRNKIKIEDLKNLSVEFIKYNRK